MCVVVVAAISIMTSAIAILVAVPVLLAALISFPPHPAGASQTAVNVVSSRSYRRNSIYLKVGHLGGRSAP